MRTIGRITAFISLVLLTVALWALIALPNSQGDDGFGYFSIVIFAGAWFLVFGAIAMVLLRTNKKE